MYTWPMRESNKTADSRREAFLDTAEELFTEFGYENASIERLISRLGVSKGAFYHYFRSKSDLLDAMIDRILARFQTNFAEILESRGPAVEKLQKILNSFFTGSSAHRKLATQLGDLLLNEANAVLISRHRQAARERFVPLLNEIIIQGLNEGEFHVETPRRVAHIIWDIGQSWDEAVYRALFEAGEAPTQRDELLLLNKSYTLAIERVLGAPEGSLYIDAKLLEPWIETASRHKAQDNPDLSNAQQASALN